MCPEAFDGGPIAIVKDGDIIEIDINKRSLNILISEEEITHRLKIWNPINIKPLSGYLRIYRKLVSSAKYGAYLS